MSENGGIRVIRGNVYRVLFETYASFKSHVDSDARRHA